MLAVVGTPYHSRDAEESCWVESGEALVLTAHVTCCRSRDPKGLSLANFGLVALPSSFPICNVGGKIPPSLKVDRFGSDPSFARSCLGHDT